MSEFMLIRPDRSGAGHSRNDNSDDSVAIVQLMEACLVALDRVGAGVSAAYLSMAIDQARIQFNLNEDGSETDQSSPDTIG